MNPTADRSPRPADLDKQLTSVDGLTQLSFLTLGLLEHRAGEHGVSVVQTRLLGVLRDRTPTMNELAKAARTRQIEHHRTRRPRRAPRARQTDRVERRPARGAGRARR
jgi:hypothetical protein